MFIDYKNHPKKSFPELIRTYQNNFLILDDVLADEDSFAIIYQDMLDLLKYGLELKYVREFPIKFIIHHGDEKQVVDTTKVARSDVQEFSESSIETLDNFHVLQCRHFLSNMVMWYAFMKMERVDLMTERHIIDWVDKDVKFIESWVNEEIIPIYDGEYHELNAILDEIFFHMKAISDAFCLIFGYSASIYDIMQAERANPEIHDILYGHIDPTLQPKELEEKLRDLNNRLMENFAKSDSDLRPLIKSGKNISADQFREIFLRAGFKSDISNRTIPWFLDCNLLITGIDTPAAFYIYAESGRKALMNGKLSMSKPGALSKKMNHNSTTAILRKDHEHCNSTRPVRYTIEDEDFLKLLDKRWYYDEQGNLKLLNCKTDHHLIGKTYRFRSPCTCTSKEGVCELCYGTLFNINSDLHSPGSLAATVTTEPTSQLILKAKHVQATDSDEISFGPDFEKNFEIVSTEITLSDDADTELMIVLGPVKMEDTDDGEAYYVDYFDLVNYNGELLGHVQEEHGYQLYLSPTMIQAWKLSKGKPIPFAGFDDDDSTILFYIEIKSKAITQSLQLITAALDSKDHLGHTNDLDGLCQRYGRIMIDAGIKYNFVHNEMIIRNLLRTKDDELAFPDFGPNGNHEDYTILRLTSSLSKNPSPLIRLSTGWLKKSLTSTTLYKAKAPSHIDALFVPVLSDVVDQ